MALTMGRMSAYRVNVFPYLSPISSVPSVRCSLFVRLKYPSSSCCSHMLKLNVSRGPSSTSRFFHIGCRASQAPMDCPDSLPSPAGKPKGGASTKKKSTSGQEKKRVAVEYVSLSVEDAMKEVLLVSENIVQIKKPNAGSMPVPLHKTTVSRRKNNAATAKSKETLPDVEKEQDHGSSDAAESSVSLRKGVVTQRKSTVSKIDEDIPQQLMCGIASPSKKKPSTARRKPKTEAIEEEAGKGDFQKLACDNHLDDISQAKNKPLTTRRKRKTVVAEEEAGSSLGISGQQPLSAVDSYLDDILQAKDKPLTTRSKRKAVVVEKEAGSSLGISGQQPLSAGDNYLGDIPQAKDKPLTTGRKRKTVVVEEEAGLPLGLSGQKPLSAGDNYLGDIPQAKKKPLTTRRKQKTVVVEKEAQSFLGISGQQPLPPAEEVRSSLGISGQQPLSPADIVGELSREFVEAPSLAPIRTSHRSCGENIFVNDLSAALESVSDNEIVGASTSDQTVAHKQKVSTRQKAMSSSQVNDIFIAQKLATSHNTNQLKDSSSLGYKEVDSAHVCLKENTAVDHSRERSVGKYNFNKTFLNSMRGSGSAEDPERRDFNMGRAMGSDKKAPKKFSVRHVVANQASTSSYLQIYGTGYDVGDTIPTVLLFFDRRRFIFNVGEGLHRFCMEHRFKLSKIDHVFLTRVCSETTGGLPGLLLALAEMGGTGLTAQTWGPSNLEDLIKAMCAFVPSDWVRYTHCFGPKDDDIESVFSESSPLILLVNDELVKISAVILHPRSMQKENSSRSASGVSVDVTSPILQDREGREVLGSSMSVVYICELSRVAGRFDPAKALAKGLKPGPKYGKLQRGESVLSDDGMTEVHPEDVLGPSHPGPIMMLIDCPSSSHVQALLSSRSLQSYFSGSGKVVNCMVHITPAHITRSKDYQDWMGNFKDAQHLLTRRKEFGMPILESSAQLLVQLNLTCPQLFPADWYSSQNSHIINNWKGANGHTTDAENLLKFHLRPLALLGPDSSNVLEPFNFFATQKLLLQQNSKICEAQKMVKNVFREKLELDANEGSLPSEMIPNCLKGVTRKEMEVVFLGTGSSQPSKYRNVTGIYIHLFENGGILLDCGEGTYAQLRRRYGPEHADEVLMGLRCIWISHIHADHHVGLTRLLSARKKFLSQKDCEPILVIGPKNLRRYLNAYQKVEDLAFEFLDCSQTVKNVGRASRTGFSIIKDNAGVSSKDESSHLKGQMQYLWKQPGFHALEGSDTVGRERLHNVLQCLGLKELISVPVLHCPHAFGVVLEARGKLDQGSQRQAGWKLVYSGDTRPCQTLVEASQDATILIHEVNFLKIHQQMGRCRVPLVPAHVHVHTQSAYSHIETEK